MRTSVPIAGLCVVMLRAAGAIADANFPATVESIQPSWQLKDLAGHEVTLEDYQSDLLNGFHEDGVPLAMPAKGANPNLTDQDLKDVHVYLHKRYGCG